MRFVTDGLERAVELAREAAGDKDVSVCAADPVQQLLRAGLLDEIEVSVTPCLLGGGVRLFDHLGADPIDLEQISVTPSDGVTHLRYRVVRAERRPTPTRRPPSQRRSARRTSRRGIVAASSYCGARARNRGGGAGSVMRVRYRPRSARALT